MRREAEVRELLISNAIHLIATEGFEGATTKALTHGGGTLEGFKMNEVYIYRIFGGKEQLYEAAFLRLDHELFHVLNHGIELFRLDDHAVKVRLREFFRTVWEFILGNEEKCRCYVRYYYSVYFKGRAREEHRRMFEDAIRPTRPTFKREANVFEILHSVFTSLFDFAIRVYNGDLEDNEENRTHIFNVLHCMTLTYLADPASVS